MSQLYNCQQDVISLFSFANYSCTDTFNVNLTKMHYVNLTKMHYKVTKD